MMHSYYGGLDFGTSGARISIISNNYQIVFENSTNYLFEFKNPTGWIIACEELLESIPNFIKENLSNISISGTSGTLLACSTKGDFLGNAIPYNESCIINDRNQSSYIDGLVTGAVFSYQYLAGSCWWEIP